MPAACSTPVSRPTSRPTPVISYFDSAFRLREKREKEEGCRTDPACAAPGFGCHVFKGPHAWWVNDDKTSIMPRRCLHTTLLSDTSITARRCSKIQVSLVRL